MGMFDFDEMYYPAGDYFKLQSDRNFWKKNYEGLEKGYFVLYEWIKEHGGDPEELLKDI